MKTATISEAKNKLSRLIDWVKAGESVIITDRDIPVARLEGVSGSSGDPSGRLERLERQGLVKRGKGRISPEFFAMHGAKLEKGGDILQALLEEREESPR